MAAVLYFAYGANMETRRFRRRCPGADVLGRALLRNYRLAFTRYDRAEKGGVADIVAEAGAQVWGALYEIDEKCLRALDEYEGAPRAAYSENERSAPGNLRPAGYVWNAWAKGYKLGVQAASDHLSTHISYACTIAEEFTREGMIDAMKKRPSYGATDNIILDYRLQAGDKEYLQGDIVTVAGDFRLSVRVIGTKPIRQIDIIRDQSFIHNRQNLGEEVNFTFVDNEAEAGEHYYYVRVIQADGNLAWSSPIWVTRSR